MTDIDDELSGEPCSVVGPGCDAPAGYLYGDTVVKGESHAEYQCDECWEPVCGSCSRLMKDGKRWCDNCSDGYEGLVADDEKAELPPHVEGSMRVMSRMCSTCVFGANSPVGPARMRDLEQTWSARDCHQTCHHAGTGDGDGELHGEDVVCHGFLRNVYLRHGVGQNLRIAERLLGGLTYVEPPTFDDMLGRTRETDGD